jgi:antibiotic biosynthesis monooxygenase (ABM) superfamily enzyme
VREESVTVAVAYRVAPGRENDFRSWATDVLGSAAQLPGFLGGGILATRASDAAGSEWHVVQRFDSEEAAQAWEYSETRMQWEGYANPFAQQTERRSIRGLIGWFDSASAPEDAAQPPPPPAPPSPPPKWKLWFVNMSAVFPPVLIFNLAALPYLGSLNPLIRTLLLCLSVTALVTWVLMPRLQRFLKKWLYPPLQALRGRHKRRSA